MKYSIVFKLRGALAEAVAVEWTDRADPRGSGDGWEPCLRLQGGDWRIASYGGGTAHWRDPGLFDNIGLRYRLAAAGPWSAVSESRKAITIVAVAPAALAAADWTPLAPADAGGAVGAFALHGAAAAAKAVEWSRAGAADWQPCLGLGGGRWRLAATAGLAGEPLALRYAFAAEGPWSPASPEAKVLVTGLAFLPLLLAAPTLAGTGRVGTGVSVDPGLWAGDPLPSLTLQWRCDGADLPGATGAAFVPGPAEDGRELACAVTARNLAGSATAVTAGLRVAYAPPVARGGLYEEIFDEGSGPQTVDAAADFTGENLSWSVAGAGATIDAAGLVTIPTDRPLAERVTVTATNSGGAASSGFMVTVEGEGAEIPRTPTAADWGLEAVSLAAGTHTGVFTLSPALGAVEVQWLGLDVASFATEAELEPHYNPTVALGGDRWRHASPAGKSGVHLRANGTGLPHVRMRYRIAADGPWSSPSENRRTLDASLLPAEPPAAEGWSVVPFRTAEEKALGLKGGDQGQFYHGMCRSTSDPSLILAGQDTAGTWWSDDDGLTWSKSVDSGLLGFGLQGVLVDPADPNRWYCVGERLWTGSESTPDSGIYLSTDKGRSWSQVYSAPTAHHQRVPATIVWEPGTGGAGLTLYTTITQWDGSARVVRSTDRGETWTLRSTIPASAAAPAVRGRVNALYHHPSLSGVLFLCTQHGLFESDNGGTGWTRMNGTGGLPVGEVMNVEVNPANGDEIYACVSQPPPSNGVPASLGLWRTTNGGSRWTRIDTPSGFNVSKIFVGNQQGGGWAPVASRDLYLIPKGDRMVVSHNGGATWAQSAVSPQPGRDSDWDKAINDSGQGNVRPAAVTSVLPHPHIRGRAFIHANSHNFRTDDAGDSCRYSGEGFSGEIWTVSLSGVAFSTDPLRFAFGMTDSGYRITEDGGQSFYIGSVYGYTEAGESLKNSSHSIAIHPTDPSKTLVTAGFKEGNSQTRLFYSDNRFPGRYVPTGGNPRTPTAGSPWVRSRDDDHNFPFLKWHRDTPSIVYCTLGRSNAGGAPGSWTGYGSGFHNPRAIFHEDNDIIFGLGRSTGPERFTLIRSDNRGATVHSEVSIPWGGLLYGDFYNVILAIHPTDPAIFFTISSTDDLARYDGNTGTWRTNYGLKALHKAAHPGGAPNPTVRSIALDPQDANVGYVGIEDIGNHSIWRSENIQAASPDWENVSMDFPRVSTGPMLVVHPLTGDVFAGKDGVGGVRMLPPPGRRSHPSLTGNRSVL